MRNGNKLDQLRCQYSCGNRQNNQTISNSYTYKGTSKKGDIYTSIH